MAQFDVCRVRGGGLVIDCQSDLLDGLPTRFVVPLRPTDASVMQRLTPVFEVDGQTLAMVTPLAGAMDRRDIHEVIVSLVEHEFVIKAALDMLVSGY